MIFDKTIKVQKSSKIIASAAILFLLIRLAVIFFGSSKFFCESELYRGTTAHEIMTNFAWPLPLYQAEVHTGGTLIARESIRKEELKLTAENYANSGKEDKALHVYQYMTKHYP